MTHAVEPSPERRQHSRVHRVVVVDTVGNRAIPWQALGLLANLHRKGEIDEAMLATAEQFHRMFQAAALDPLRAADMARVGGGSVATGAGHGSDAARRQVRATIATLGGQASLAGSILWDVVGEDRSIRHWSQQHGRDPKVAKGILIASLDRLAAFWGLT
jgi:hypothetical protein